MIKTIARAVAFVLPMLAFGGAWSVVRAELPLLSPGQIQWLGGARFPIMNMQADIHSMNIGKGPIAIKPGTDSLFAIGFSGFNVAEFGLPNLVRSTKASELPYVEVRQKFSTISLRARAPSNSQGVADDWGMLYYDGHLLINGGVYYDAGGTGTDTTLWVDDPTDLENTTVQGFYRLAGGARTAAWMSPISPEWQEALGGKYLVGGEAGIPIIGRLCPGVCAAVFDPDDMRGAEPGATIPVKFLLDYSAQHPYDGDWNNRRGDSEWTHLTAVAFGLIVPGTRTLLAIGYTAATYHGYAAEDIPRDANGGVIPGICYKTEGCGYFAHGYSSYDKSDKHQVFWMFDMNDVVRVMNDETDSWNLRAYAYGEFDTGYPADAVNSRYITAGTFDPTTRTMYLLMARGDLVGAFTKNPVLLAYEFDVAALR